MTDTLPATVNGATLVWNNERHYVVANGVTPDGLFEFDDGTAVPATIISAVGVNGQWLCQECGVVLRASVCECRFPPGDDDPF